MTVKFEVGKKYTRNKGIYRREVVQCIALTTTNKPVVEALGTGVVFVANEDGFWNEYKEPKRGTVWVNVYNDGSANACKTKRLADSLSGNRIACVEVPWVEGQGLE